MIVYVLLYATYRYLSMGFADFFKNRLVPLSDFMIIYFCKLKYNSVY